MANLVNAERISIAFGTRILLDGVSLGLNTGDVVGVVGRNGDGKTTLLKLLVGAVEPDSGRVVRNASIGYLGQGEDFASGASVRDVIVEGRPDHTWAADAASRDVVTNLLAGIDLDRPVSELSGGERRRTALASVLLGGHDLLVLDEPTNHLDVEAITWLAAHLSRLQAAGVAMLVVSHDRWFLDAVCTRVWEVHDAVVDSYDGGYAAYVLARAERVRQAAANEARRQNLLRKELAWLRRGPPARTSKPRFRIDAANALIRDVPEARDTIRLREFATSRLGKDVFDLKAMTYALGDRTLFDHVDWSIGPGMRIGIIGVNGSGKSTLLRLLAGDIHPTSGKVKQGRTLRVGTLRQDLAGRGSTPVIPGSTPVTPGPTPVTLASTPVIPGSTRDPRRPTGDSRTELPTSAVITEEVDPAERVLDSIQRLQRRVKLATGVESSASSLLEDFGFRADLLVTRIGELSGGERRRLEFLRLLLAEPNVLLLDEPTNDLDIDTLTVVEDYLDTWPGTLIVVSHDRYFLERTCDAIYALTGDGKCVLLPGGVDEYLARREAATQDAAQGRSPGPAKGATPSSRSATDVRVGDAAAQRQARKDLARLESQLNRQHEAIERLHRQLEAHASDYARLVTLGQELQDAEAKRDSLEDQWLEAASLLEE